MQTLLFVLALCGIVMGAYSLFLPSLRKRGWSLPLMRLVAGDDEDDDDDDLDQPFEHFLEPKAVKGPGGKSPVPDRFMIKPGSEMAPLPSKPKPRRAKPIIEDDEEDEDLEALAIIETPNADKDPDDLELDPELAALLEDDVDDDDDEAEDSDVAGDSVETSETEAAPAAEAETQAASSGGLSDDMLALFEETETLDAVPTALREAVPPATIEELQQAARDMRALFSTGSQSDSHAA